MPLNTKANTTIFFPFLANACCVVTSTTSHKRKELPKLIGSLPKMCIFLYQQKYLTFKYYIYILQVNPLGVCFYNHTCYYINATIWNGPPELTVPIYGYIMPMVLLVTFICNALIIIVLSKKHMRTPTNLVLLAMAVSDLLTIVWPAPW